MSAAIARTRFAALVVIVLCASCAGRAHFNPDILRRHGESRGSAAVPQECGPGAEHGNIGPGSVVILHAHRAVDGSANWISAMDRFVGRATRVTARSGRDPSGCPVVRVSIDEGAHFWRVRDMIFPGRGFGPGGGEAIPQRCNQVEDSAGYGLVQPGATVVTWMHRPLDGDANWAEGMSEHVAVETQVTGSGGVDASGCPVVRVAADGGAFVWRIRDLSLVEPALPQVCGESTEEPHGALAVGSTVRLGRHRPVRGQDGWQGSMDRYVGTVARVTSLGPPDDQGCPVVHVDADSGARPWRVRDLSLVDDAAGVGGGSAPPSFPPPPAVGIGSGEVPQHCGQAPGSEQYGPIREGSRVVLGRHRPVDGDDNWTEEMNEFVGRTGVVTSLSGADSVGCPGVRVDIDGGEWFWRVRDVRPTP